MSLSKPVSPVKRRAYLALGSNLGNRVAYLEKACSLLLGYPITILKSSPVYETAPVGPQDQDDFLNQVLEIQTSLSPFDLLKSCQNIEQCLGRERTLHWGPRTIDIDILLYENQYIADPQLIIPHPQMKKRAFVLVPLADIAPQIILDGESVQTLLKKVDRAGVRPYKIQ